MIKGYAVYFRGERVACFHDEDGACDFVSSLEHGGDMREYSILCEDMRLEECEDEDAPAATIN